MKKVEIASAMIWDEAREKVLMVKNENHGEQYWSMPGGAVEANETLHEAVRRETKEETGLSVRTGNLYMVREVLFEKKGHHAMIFTFEAAIIGGEIRIEDPDQEIMNVEWMDLQRANQLMSYLPEKIKTAEPASRYYFQVSNDF